MSPPSSRTLSRYSSLCCTGGKNVGEGVYCKFVLFPAVGGIWYGRHAVPKVFGKHCSATSRPTIIPRSHFWRGCAVYRHRDPVGRRDGKREAEAGRRPGGKCIIQRLRAQGEFRKHFL